MTVAPRNQLDEAREEARRWRRSYEELSRFVTDPDYDLFDFDRRIREWVAGV